MLLQVKNIHIIINPSYYFISIKYAVLVILFNQNHSSRTINVTQKVNPPSCHSTLGGATMSVAMTTWGGRPRPHPLRNSETDY